MIPKSKDHKETRFESSAKRQQLLKWLNGTSTHCYFGYGKEDYECCPDFSCCHPALMRPRDERQRYVDADKGERHRMLATFLEAFLNRAQKKVSVQH